MINSPHFIGLGAQKAGTSWIYACLHEHPQICMPKKEIHFFSRERNWSKGYKWYEDLFKNCCNQEYVVGEFSTTYLHTRVSAQRIFNRYPKTKLIISLRNPVDRAVSNYYNDIKTGVVDSDISFEKALENHPEYVSQGKYKGQIEHFLNYFPREQILILIYEDINKDPLGFMKTIYSFLEVDPEFVPSLLNKKVNIARTPKYLWIDSSIRIISKYLRESEKGKKMWWTIKKSGLPDLFRLFNTKTTKKPQINKNIVASDFKEDIDYIQSLLPERILNW